MKKIMVMSMGLLLGLASVAVAQATNGNPSGVSTQSGSTGSSTQGGTGTMQQDRPSKPERKMKSGKSTGMDSNTLNSSSTNSGTGKMKKSRKIRRTPSDRKTAPSAANS